LNQPSEKEIKSEIGKDNRSDIELRNLLNSNAGSRVFSSLDENVNKHGKDHYE